MIKKRDTNVFPAVQQQKSCTSQTKEETEKKKTIKNLVPNPEPCGTPTVPLVYVGQTTLERLMRDPNKSILSNITITVCRGYFHLLVFVAFFLNVLENKDVH